MTKREFLRTLGLAAIALGRPPAPAPASQTKRLKNFVWMRPSLTKTAAEWQHDFGLMRASGIHAIAPEIYNGSQALFQSRRLPTKGWRKR